MVYRESLREDIGLDLPEINLTIKQTINAPLFLPVSQKQKDKENIISKKNPVKYRIPVLSPISADQLKLQTSHKAGKPCLFVAAFGGVTFTWLHLKVPPNLQAMYPIGQL